LLEALEVVLLIQSMLLLGLMPLVQTVASYAAAGAKVVFGDKAACN
jgi:hypothetical protein